MGYYVAVYLQQTLISRACTRMWTRSLITGLGFGRLEDNTAGKPRMPLFH